MLYGHQSVSRLLRFMIHLPAYGQGKQSLGDPKAPGSQVRTIPALSMVIMESEPETDSPYLSNFHF